MAEEFKPITTQEDFDAAISARLARQKETLEAGFKTEKDGLAETIRKNEEELASLRQTAGKVEGQEKELNELRGQIAGYQRTALAERIAEEAGLPRALASRLTGEDEAAMRDDAQALAKLVTGAPAAPPLAYNDRASANPIDAAWNSMLSDIRSE